MEPPVKRWPNPPPRALLCQQQLRSLLFGLLATLLLSGCGATAVNVEQASFPEPLVTKLPLHMAVHFPESFSNYRLEERIPEQGEWSIDIGQAQVAMFRRLLPGMFERVEEVEVLSAATLSESIDGVLIPRVEEMQFAIPAQTRGNFFEVWIRYRMTLQNASGKTVAEWPVTAYGKTRDEMLESAEAALRDAAIAALRDAGAFLAIGFASQPQLEPWLQAQLAQASSVPADPDTGGQGNGNLQ